VISDVNAVLSWYKPLEGEEKNPMKNESDLVEGKKECMPTHCDNNSKEKKFMKTVSSGRKRKREVHQETFYFLKKPPS